MVKRYYCDFCDKSFQDNPQSRKRHLNGIAHKRNRRLHYDTVGLQLAAAPPQSNAASVLYSNLSGKEILQQWIDKHPQVIQKYQAVQAKEKKGEKAESCELTKASRSIQKPATATAERQLPAELQPYSDNLPPSLLPPESRSQFPGSAHTPQWGRATDSYP